MRRSMWCVVKLGMDRTKLAASLALWTRERCSGFGAVARRHSEGRDESSLCVNPLFLTAIKWKISNEKQCIIQFGITFIHIIL